MPVDEQMLKDRALAPEDFQRARKPLNMNLTEFRKDFKRVEQRMDDISGGAVRSGGEFTVATGAATTTVLHYGCSSLSYVGLMPLDATTALEYALGTTWVVPDQGEFVVNHPNNADVRKYRYVFFTSKSK